MKILFAFFLFAASLPIFSVASDAPNYSIPDNAVINRRSCLLTERVRKWEQGQWSNWVNEQSRNSWRVARWQEGRETLQVFSETEGKEVRFVRSLSENGTVREYIEHWRKLADESWQLQKETVVVSYEREGGDLRRVEHYDDGRRLEWRLTSGYQGRLQEFRELIYPGLLDRPNRRYSRYYEACDVY